MNRFRLLRTRRAALRQLVALPFSAPLLSLSQDAAAAQVRQETPLAPFYLPPAPPLQLGSSGLALRTRVRSTQTNRQYSCVEFVIGAKQMGPPPHVHRDLDEIMYVLAGTVTVLVGETLYTVPAGGWHLRPRGLVHTFWNATAQPAHYLDMYFNQNFEDFLEELNEHLLPDMVRQQLTPADPGIAKRWADLDRRFGITTFFEQRQPLIERYGLKA